MRLRFAVGCVAGGLLVSACGSGSAHDEGNIATSVSALTVPAGCATLDFDVNAPEPASIALTFDDGPESSGTTLQVLDILKSEGVQATFFINTNDAIDVLASSSARLAITRMVSEGHQIGNHTVHHYSLAATTTDVNAELSGVVDVLRTVAPSALSLRLVRAPFGEPYFGPQATLDTVAPIVGRYGVHVGWNVDSRDWACKSELDPPACVKKNVLDLVDAGKSGIVLLHSTQPATVTILPDLIAALRTRGKKFIGIEELVVAKYSKPSRRLFRCVSSAECWGGDVCGTDNRCGAATSTDAGPADTSAPDTHVPDTYVADTFVPDTFVPDTFVPDTFKPDTFKPDTFVPDTFVPDTFVPDLGTDTSALAVERIGSVPELRAPWDPPREIDASTEAPTDLPARDDASASTGCGVGSSRGGSASFFALGIALLVMRASRAWGAGRR